MKKRLFRLAAPVAVAGALMGGSLVMAGPAQATTGDCVQYVDDRGYNITQFRVDACDIGSGGSSYSQAVCPGILTGSGVRDSHATTACRLAD